MKTNKSKLSSLKSVLKYRNQEVIARFCADYGVSKREAQIIFSDLIRFLWLSVWARRELPKPKKLGMLGAMSIVDEMWHCFLIFTEDYKKFGMKYFGIFVRHEPESLLKKRSKANHEKYHSAIFEETVDLVWDNLGPQIANRWFLDYPKKYSMKKIRSMQLAAVKK